MIRNSRLKHLTARLALLLALSRVVACRCVRSTNGSVDNSSDNSSAGLVGHLGGTAQHHAPAIPLSDHQRPKQRVRAAAAASHGRPRRHQVNHLAPTTAVQDEWPGMLGRRAEAMAAMAAAAARQAT